VNSRWDKNVGKEEAFRKDVANNIYKGCRSVYLRACLFPIEREKNNAILTVFSS
jgi:hypothetical protein